MLAKVGGGEDVEGRRKEREREGGKRVGKGARGRGETRRRMESERCCRRRGEPQKEEQDKIVKKINEGGLK